MNYSVPVYSIFRHTHTQIAVLNVVSTTISFGPIAISWPLCLILLVALWPNHRRGVHSDKQLAIIIGNCIILYYSFWLVVSSYISYIYIYHIYIYISYIYIYISYIYIYISYIYISYIYIYHIYIYITYIYTSYIYIYTYIIYIYIFHKYIYTP